MGFVDYEENTKKAIRMDIARHFQGFLKGNNFEYSITANQKVHRFYFTYKFIEYVESFGVKMRINPCGNAVPQRLIIVFDNEEMALYSYPELKIRVPLTEIIRFDPDWYIDKHKDYKAMAIMTTRGTFLIVTDQEDDIGW